jgi:phosphotransacetylase
MSILQRIRERAAADPQRIVLPEGEDPRTIAAAAICARERLAHVTVLGNEPSTVTCAPRSVRPGLTSAAWCR